MNVRRMVLFVAAVTFAAGVVRGDWTPGDSYKMHFPQLPDPQGWDIEFVTSQHEVADDWLCTETGPVSDIHFWYSVAQDLPTRIDTVTAIIYKDVPANSPPEPVPFSHPGEELWRRTFDASQFKVSDQIGIGTQGFADPQQPNYIGWGANDHHQFRQINIVDIQNPLVQQQGTIYWLGLYVDWTGTQSPAGWKTSLEHFQDDAVYRTLQGSWAELISPAGVSLDMAFVITTIPEPATLLLSLLGTCGVVMTSRRRS